MSRNGHQDRPRHPMTPTEDDGFVTVHPDLRATAPDPVAEAVGDLAKGLTLRAAIKRIDRKAQIMLQDAEHGSMIHQHASEIRLLVGIAQRALGEGDAG